MIFGKTLIEKEREKQKKFAKDYLKIKKKFAWFPLSLSDGRTAWMVNVFYFTKIYKSIDGSYYTRNCFFEYSYRESESELIEIKNKILNGES